MTAASTETHRSPTRQDGVLPETDIELQFNWRTPPERTFADVGGMQNLKQELRRIVVQPLGDKRDAYERFGIDIPNLLFSGPPGTGKSYSAAALAGELEFPFVLLTAGRLKSRWINESTDHVQRLFREAAQISESHGYAVVIAEEMDTLLPERGAGDRHQEDEEVVTEFLSYLERTNQNDILFVGTTNRPDKLDDAAVRPGRFDRRFRFTLPTLPTRRAIFEQELADRPTSVTGAELSTLAEETEGASAATISQVVDEAARYAVENGEDAISTAQLRRAIADYVGQGDGGGSE